MNVTAWVHREMGFGEQEQRFRVHAAVTGQLLRTLHTIPPAIGYFQTVRGRGNDVLWLAGWSLRKAREVGMNFAYFQAVLPTAEEEEDCKSLEFSVEGRKEQESCQALACMECRAREAWKDAVGFRAPASGRSPLVLNV